MLSVPSVVKRFYAVAVAVAVSISVLSVLSVVEMSYAVAVAVSISALSVSSVASVFACGFVVSRRQLPLQFVTL